MSSDTSDTVEYSKQINDTVSDGLAVIRSHLGRIEAKVAALAATTEKEFDAALTHVWRDDFRGSERGFSSIRLAISMNTKYNPMFNQAYIAGVDQFLFEKRRLMHIGTEVTVAHHEAKIIGHREFCRIRDELVAKKNGDD